MRVRVRAAAHQFGAFWWDFIVGEDWRLALTVVVGLVCTGGLAATGAPAWWLLPIAVAAAMLLSLAAARRDS